MQSVVVHGHFYQPPREDPWRNEVELEPGAAPFHDWNARISHECYEPFAAARLLDPAGHVQGTINLYEWVSFDAATTLLQWLEPHAPEVYRAMLEADRASARRLGGHGNAVAMPWHHLILPLASRRDKVTEVRWGLADFRRRFARDAEGMWLPETAVDEETLVVLAEAGLRFTILAPHQVANPPADGRPLRFDAGGGRTIALFIYDGPLASDSAFGPLLTNADDLARRLAPGAADTAHRGPAPAIASLAVDGETFGHHHKFAEMALARAVAVLRQRAGVRIENYSSALRRFPPREDAQLVEPSSWSCPHGIERWRANCGCRTAPGMTQEWRRPLRAALNWLSRELDERFETGTATLFDDAWGVRDAFGEAAALPDADRLAFVDARVRTGADAARALRLLDAARSRLGMFGSCAWFFDDVAGLETVLMLRLAAHAMDLTGDATLEPRFIQRLVLAQSNDAAEGDAAQVYRGRVMPLRARPAA
ncbi:MAG: DUF3536 domain-containing protein [Gemmatimonadales bacterium]